MLTLLHWHICLHAFDAASAVEESLPIWSKRATSVEITHNSW